jgi:MerR family transcriptional regulator, copper efflux regulator
MRMRRTSVATLDLADAKRAGFLNISEVAKDTGVSAKMIRHYESLGLLKPAKRTYAGYRIYEQKDVHLLRFIRRARDLGFGIKEVDRLLGLWQDRRRASADVRRVARQHLADLDHKIAALEDMRRTLERLVEDCRGDHRPDCPILEDLAHVSDETGGR